MAESVIKALITDYVVVAESGSTNESFANKLAKLQNAYNSLSNKQKIKSFLLQGDSSVYYHVSGSKYFQSDVTSTQSSGIDIMTFTVMTISTATRYRASITGTSSKFDNTSSSTDSSSLALCYWL